MTERRGIEQRTIDEAGKWICGMLVGVRRQRGERLEFAHDA